MKNKRRYILPLENIIFTIRHHVHKRIIQDAQFDVIASVKHDMAVSLAKVIIENKKECIIETPLSDRPIDNVLKLLMEQEIEFSMQLVVMTREELRKYTKAKILSLTYDDFTKLKKENK
jgi:hypothetical protein